MVILNEGLTGFTFFFKPDAPINKSIQGEQFLVVDFQNFEIRDSVPNLPHIEIVHFRESVSEEDLDLDPQLAEKSGIKYFDSAAQGWNYDEGLFFLPLLSEIGGSAIKLYRITVKYSENSFLQSVKFTIGVYYPFGNSNVRFDTRIPLVANKGTSSVLAIPFEYNNKPKTLDKDDNRMNSIDCGLEINVCQG